MLNASRHHRKNRALRRRPRTGRKVLNASRHHRKNRRRCRSAFCCAMPSAQRLAASQEKSRPPGAAPPGAHDVLNASRHHRKNRTTSRFKLAVWLWCSTPRGITGKIARSLALDSLSKRRSAQRLAASQEKSRVESKGIAVSRAVLNASRHHRKNRTPAAAKSALSVLCSTPRGITGKIATVRPRASVWRNMCSTPRGITGKIAPRRCWR